MVLGVNMKLDQITFYGCCGTHGYAEVKTQTGWLAIMKSHDGGELKARQFDANKMPVSDWADVTPEQVDSNL